MEAEGSSGNQAVVSVEVENAAGTEGGQFILNYDSALVRPVVVEAGKLIAEARSSFHMVNLEYAPGQLMFMWVTVFADTDNAGVVCTITFELLKEGISGLTFGEVIVAPDGIRTGEIIAGKISIGDMEVDQDDSEPNSLEQEDEAV
ncbi:MAG: cohesin domain-containing protein, partial [Clostridia bacterium]|nr:cohesin domain-containing protein [Clostridia bacterium]